MNQGMRTGMWTMALRNVARNPRRSILSALAIGIAALTMVLMFSFIVGIVADLKENIQRYMAGHVLIQAKGVEQGQRVTDAFVPGLKDLSTALLAQVPGVQISPRISGGASIFEEGDSFFFPFLGLDFSKDPMDLGRFMEAGGRMPEPGKREALVTRALADRLGLDLGGTLTPMTQTTMGSANGMSFTITGIVRPNLGQYAGNFLFTSLETAQRLVFLEDGAFMVLLLAPGGLSADEGAVAELLAKSQEVLTQGNQSPWASLEARPWDGISSTYGMLRIMTLVYGFVALFFFGLASTVIVNTMLMVVLERGKEIGTLAAMGMEPGKIRGLFLAESFVLSLGGAVAGTIFGIIIAIVLQQVGLDFSSAMEGVSLEVSTIFRPVLTWENPVIVIGGATLVAVGATLMPTRRIIKMNIVDALRGLS